MQQQTNKIIKQQRETKNKFSLQNSYKKLTLVSMLAATIFSACTKDKNKAISPAQHIMESEKMLIPAEVDLPANLPNGNSRVITFYAEGVQKYKAKEKAGSNPVTYEWVLVAPLADLYDITNAKVGTHTAGPTWQLSPQDSIYAQHFSPAKTAPSPDPGSVDWLLLKPKENVKAPTGVFVNVEYIQRIATKGGKAPAALPTKLTDTVDVFYTAIYRFTKKN